MEDQLEIFRTAWAGTHVMVYDSYMTYNVVKGFSKSASSRAMELIASLNLDLIAETTSDSTFTVKIIDNENNKRD